MLNALTHKSSLKSNASKAKAQTLTAIALLKLILSFGKGKFDTTVVDESKGNGNPDLVPIGQQK